MDYFSTGSSLCVFHDPQIYLENEEAFSRFQVLNYVLWSQHHFLKSSPAVLG